MFGGGLSAKACALDYLKEEGPGLWGTASPRYLKLSFQRRLKQWSWTTTPVVSQPMVIADLRDLLAKPILLCFSMQTRREVREEAPHDPAPPLPAPAEVPGYVCGLFASSVFFFFVCVCMCFIFNFKVCNDVSDHVNDGCIQCALPTYTKTIFFNTFKNYMYLYIIQCFETQMQSEANAMKKWKMIRVEGYEGSNYLFDLINAHFLF